MESLKKKSNNHNQSKDNTKVKDNFQNLINAEKFKKILHS